MPTPPTVETDLLQITTLNDSSQIRMAEEGLPTETVAQLRSLGLSFTEVAELVIPPRDAEASDCTRRAAVDRRD